jgi:cobalt/nickel transport system ATP-binding protein
MPDAHLALDIRQLTFRYPDGTTALDGIELQVRQGERLALLGPNGAGKSTLLLHINGLLRGEGEVTVFGLPVAGRNLQAIRQYTGLVFQSPDDQLFMPTVFDEVAYAALNAGYPDAEVRRRVAEAMAMVGISHLSEKHPANLSIGQKKRVCLASVLVTDTRLLVLDEPSAGLDPAGRSSLLGLIQSLSTTLVLATHDLEFALATCPRAVAMRDGRIIATGPTPDLAADPAIFAP